MANTINSLQTLTKPCSSGAVIQYAALYQDTSADNTTKLPAGAASSLKFEGFARYGDANHVAGDPMEIIAEGEGLAVAGAAVSVGDALESAGATGKVQTRTSGTTIARALTAAAADGDIIRVKILRTT